MYEMESPEVAGTARPAYRDVTAATDHDRVYWRPDHGHLWPFAVVAVVGQVSAAWPPGPSNAAYFAVSCGLLAASVLLAMFVSRRPLAAGLASATVYTASVAFLMLATGGFSSGLGSLLFIPAVALALDRGRWESVWAVILIVASLVAVSLRSSDSVAADTRRVVLFVAIAGMLSIAIHALRDRLTESISQTSRLLHQAEAINMAARELASLSDPHDIRNLGVELAARIAWPAGTMPRRALYFLVEDGSVRADAQFDESGASTDGTWPLDDHASLKRAVDSLQPVLAPVDDAERVGSMGVTHGAFVPVCPDGTLDGVLAVAGRGTPISQECLERCVALGHLLELALANWNAHQRLEDQATAEERRRIARELHDGLAHELAFIASRARRSARVGGGASDLRELANAADRALDEARRAITVLSAVEPQPLAAAVTQTAEDLSQRLAVPVTVEVPEDIELPGQVTENLLRILREAITNAANHGHPRHIRVELRNHDGVRLVIQDDGCGFDVDEDPPASSFGLLSMAERATAVGGRLTVESRPRHGTRVEVALP